MAQNTNAIPTPSISFVPTRSTELKFRRAGGKHSNGKISFRVKQPAGPGCRRFLSPVFQRAPRTHSRRSSVDQVEVGTVKFARFSRLAATHQDLHFAGSGSGRG